MQQSSTQQFMKQYEYKLSTSLGIITLGFFGLFSFWGFQKAVDNDKGLIINNTFELSTQTATYFWWVSSLMFLILALLGLFMVIKSLKAPSIISLDNEQITTPKRPFNTKLLTVKYHEIEQYKVQKIGKIRQLQIDTPYGKIVIPDSNFVNKSEFDEMLQILAQKV